MTDEQLNHRLGDLRPRLHRYCARMVGSVIDGEDVVQDALMKAAAASTQLDGVENFESWLFRIAHNASIDYLRRRSKADAMVVIGDPDMIGDTEQPTDDRDIVSASLSTFMRLSPVQRSAVVLMDVLGYRLQEITHIMQASLPAVKSALHRGREQLKLFAKEPDSAPPPKWSPEQQVLLRQYVDRFNARDFDAIRDMLAEEVKLDVIDRIKRDGKVLVSSTYFENYAALEDWRFSFGFVEARPVVIAHDPQRPEAEPAYFIVVEWSGAKVASIRDFRYARYVMESAAVELPSIEGNLDPNLA